MQQVYNQLIKFMVTSGKRLAKRAGKIEDIGVTKKYLTEEDIKVERGFKEIIKKGFPTHKFFAEEENDNFLQSDDVWVCDPISGTRTFIKGLAHYGMVISHIHKGETVFAAVYDPSVDDLYTAYKNKGTYLNKNRIKIIDSNLSKPKIVFHPSLVWEDNQPDATREIFEKLTKFKLYRTYNSQAINYCHMVRGIYDGIVLLAKDSFVDFAASLIVREAGGKFTNLNGQTNINSSDRVFIAGSDSVYKILKQLVDSVLKK